MRHTFLPFLLFASAALAGQPSMSQVQVTHVGVGHGSVGVMSHSPGVAHRSVPSGVPGMAFGGSPVRRSETVQSWRDSGSVRGRESVRSARIPDEIARGWGHSGRHFWGGHYFIWDGGGWVNYDEGPIVEGYVDSSPAQSTLDSDAAVAEDSAPAMVEPAPKEAVPAAPDQSDDSLPAQVQRALKQRGYDPGPLNGRLDPQTREALLLFQKDQGLDANGRIGVQTLDALGIR